MSNVRWLNVEWFNKTRTTHSTHISALMDWSPRMESAVGIGVSQNASEHAKWGELMDLV